MTSLAKIYLSIAVMMLISLSSPALAQDKTNSGFWAPLIDSPSGETVYFKPDAALQPKPDPTWTLRTGIKKGITDSASPQEQLSGPDAAVLKNGFFEAWSGLLAEFKEPSVLVDIKRIAGLERTKPYLIIPTGALQGFSQSAFFKAGLAEYARSGGVIVCFAQQNNVDFTALPVPAGSTIEAAGWLQDAGPLFRTSSVQSRHPMLAGTRKTTPDIETSGYLISYPGESKVILSRSDGFPTLLVYPYGSGWVVVSTLFSDYSYERGQLSRDEIILVRDLLLWSKAPAQMIEAAPGEKLNFPLSIQGPEQGEASSIRISVMGTEGDKPLSEETFTMTVKPYQVQSLTFPYSVPENMQPGLYHIEYLLLNAAGLALSVKAESNTGLFSIGQPVAAAPIPRLQQPISGARAAFSIQPVLEKTGSALRLKLDILPDPNTTAGFEQLYTIRAAGQEKSFSLGVDKKSLSFAVPDLFPERLLSFIIYHSSGRSLFRGSVPLSTAPGTDVSLDKPYYLPGQNISISMINQGYGELFLTAPGYFKKDMTTGSLSASYALPANLPAGAYSMQWELTPVEGDTTHKETSLNIAGYRVRFQNASLENKIDRNGYSSVVRFRIHADQNISANIKLKLRGPDGTIIPVSEGPVSLSEGMQEIPFTFAFKAETAGIWELHYSIEAPLPQLPGFTQGPVVIAAGYSLFDIGETALLGVTATKPVYYKSSGPVELSAYLFGSGSAKIEFFLDKRKFRQERIDLSGADTFIVSIPDLIPGTHTVQAIVTGKELASAAEYALIYGAHIPDLVAGIETSCPAGLVMPVSISITNQGKLATSPCKAALYEDDPAHGGSLLSSVDVPSLGPDATHHAVVKWPLLNKSGKRKLFIIVDAENVIMESNKTNNTAMSEVTIPDLLLFATPLKNAFSADEAITFNLFAANLSTTVYKDLNIKVAFTDPAGNGLFYETVPLTEFVPGAVKNIDRSITLASLPTGTYKLGAQLANTAPLASVSSDIYVIPTLSLRGSFEGTPDSAALCMPFTLQYSIKNTGNLPVSTGALKLEIRSLDTDQLLYARQLPLTLDAKSLLIDKMDFPKGVYRITLKASVINQITRITRELDLADKKLHVVSPIIVNKSETAIPRVLLLLGNYDVSVQRAVAEKIVKESFEEGGVYYAIVDTVADFTARAKSGIFNTYVLLENNELLERADWLSEKVNSGQGLVIIGPDNKTMLTAEAFGFTFSETPAPGGAMLLFTEDSGLGLSGTMPISGPMLLPRRNGAQPAALFVGDKKAAALIDMSGKGRVMVMPFSLTHSALDTGATSLYSLLLRTAVRNVVPKTDEQTVISVQELEVSSTDPINTRIVVTVPGESGIIWTNAGGSVHNNTVSYELIANQEAQKLIFMYKYAESGKKQPVVDVSYECGGKFVVQGNVE